MENYNYGVVSCWIEKNVVVQSEKKNKIEGERNLPGIDLVNMELVTPVLTLLIKSILCELW